MLKRKQIRTLEVSLRNKNRESKMRMYLKCANISIDLSFKKKFYTLYFPSCFYKEDSIGIYIYIYIYIYVCVCVYVYIYTHTHTHTRVGVYTE